MPSLDSQLSTKILQPRSSLTDSTGVSSAMFPHGRQELARRSRWIVTAAAVTTVFLIGLLDVRFGRHVPLQLLQLLPVGAVAAVNHWPAGMVLAAGAALFGAVTLDGGRLAIPRSAIADALVQWGMLVAVAILVDLLRCAEKRGANTDALTGLYNRTALEQRTAAECNRSRRTGHPLTIAFIDCDDFKQLNDTRGHITGDELLRQIADVLRNHTRSYDTIARWGGDEFVAVLPETTAESAKIVCRRLHRQLTEVGARQSPPVSFSIGVVTYQSIPDGEDLVQRPDALMYAVKRAGKNDIRFAVVE